MTTRADLLQTPGLLLDGDRAPALRDVVGALLGGATEADFAVARIRLAVVELAEEELARVRRVRVLVGRLDADSFAVEEGSASQLERLRVLRSFLGSGRIEVRSAGLQTWVPDFSCFRGVRAGPAASPCDVVLVGAHFFGRAPASGGTLTSVIPDGAAAGSAGARFERLWSAGYDVLPAVGEAIDRLLELAGPPAALSAPWVARESSASPYGFIRSLPIPQGRKARLVAAAPRDVALRILAARFPEESAYGSAAEDSIFDLAEFQQEAVRRAEATLAARNGVLIADSVGLGKTYVGLALVERALGGGGRVAVVTPAAVRREWIAPLRRLAARFPGTAVWGLGTTGTAATIVPAVNSGAADPHPLLAWVSHTRLSRGTVPQGRLAPLDLVLVDESHAFRSPAARRYRALASLCRGARVVLLSATPVNNSPLDLYFQIRLFAGDGDFRDVGVASLREAFRTAATARVRAGLEPVVSELIIRRTRPFLRERYDGIRVPGKGVLSFPQRAPPVPLRYARDDDAAEHLAAAVAMLAALEFPAVRLREYGFGDAAPAAPDPELLRLVLLKRLESSGAAFEASLRWQIRFLEECLATLREGRVLGPAEHRRLSGSGSEGGDLLVGQQFFLPSLMLRQVPVRADRTRLSRDIRAELVRLHGLRSELEHARATDPKLALLDSLLTKELAGQKVVVFTEFRDTARYLWKHLVRRGGVGLVDGAGAFLGALPAGRRTVIDRFAPRANGARTPPERERLDILLATDVLSEGLNLQDAAHVVSYDLPWNPVRLIQRVGRIDRLGSEHDIVHSYQFLPGAALEGMLGLLARLRRKLEGIALTVGGEPEVFAGAGAALVDGDFVERLAAGDARLLDDLERRLAAPAEREERLRAAYRKALSARVEDPLHPGSPPESYPAAVIAAAALPAERQLNGDRTELSLGDGLARSAHVLVALRSGKQARMLLFDSASGELRHDPELADEILLRAVQSPTGTGDVPANGDSQPDPVLVRRALRTARRWAAGKPLCQPARDVQAKVARSLFRALAREPGGATPALCRRAEELLHRLERGATIASELALERALRGHSSRAEALALLEDLSRVIGELPGVSAPVEPAWPVGILVCRQRGDVDGSPEPG